MATPNSSRRSSRLETKLNSSIERTENLRKRRLNKKATTRFSCSSESSSSENESPILNTPIGGKRNRNNFTKEYSSYNFESKDNDYYYDDEDFIDDTATKESLEQSKRKKKIKKKLRRRHSKKGAVVETDDSNVEGASDEKHSRIPFGKGKGQRKRMFESSSGSDGEQEEKSSPKKVKKIRKWSSDDNSDHTPSRKSVRAEKLREKKANESNKMLRKLKQSRLPGSINKDEEEVESSPSNDQVELVGVSSECNAHIMSDESSEESEAECEWIVQDEEMEEEGTDLEHVNITEDIICGKEIISTMRMDSITSQILEVIQITSTDDFTNQLILAAGKADPVTFIRCLTEGANVSDAIFELKEHNLSLVHILIAAPWRYLENESPHGNKSPNRNGSPHRNKSPDSPHGNESLHVNESVITNRIDSDCRDCLSYLSKYSSKIFKQLVTGNTFNTRPNILELCVWNNRYKTIKFLLLYFTRISWDWKEPRLCFDVPSPHNWPPSLLHVAIYRLSLTDDISSESLASVVETLLEFIDEKYACERDDFNRNTALLYSAQMDYCDILQLLVRYKATLKITDSEGHTPLHLAAASGCVKCVKALLSSGHEIDCRDLKGWPPLLYAHFTEKTDCFLELMKAKPKQLSVLSDLLRMIDDNVENKRKTAKVIRNVLISLAHTEQYYNLFNEFIHDNMEILDDHSFRFMKHCMNLLSFKNKQTWMKRKLAHLIMGEAYSVSGVVLSSLPRQHLLSRVLELLWEEDDDTITSTSHYRVRPLSVSFYGEAGICTGPRREFWSILSRELGNGEEMLFEQNDDSLLSLQPCEIISSHTHPPHPPSSVVSDHHRKIRTIGSLLAAVIFHGDTVDFNLTVPLTKQLLGQSLSPVEDLKTVDEHLYEQLKDLRKQDGAESLDLPFSVTLSSSWGKEGGRPTIVDVPLTRGGLDCSVTDSNKDEYVELVSEFKLETRMKSEISALQNGFWKVLPLRYLKLFTPNEFSLLLSGVSHIDTEDWRAYTKYSGLPRSSDIVNWFWNLVDDLNEQEKGLLLKFTTGSPRLPPGGFKTLTGIGGNVHHFTLSVGEGYDKVPQARTCFNLLILTKYSSEQQLRNKVLIAIRYGCEGFEFS